MAPHEDTQPSVLHLASNQLQQAAALRDALFLCDELARVLPKYLLPLAQKLSVRLIWLLLQNPQGSLQEFQDLQERLAGLRLALSPNQARQRPLSIGAP